ncbi:WD40-repeat-containing domain protein [Sporodiniella umbellata]|nr:WD40-repeat-containing domain protein [Sporodiniella umbellata]
MHTDWVNDIVLCEQGTCVVSASSDRTIKAWKPYEDQPKTATTIGTHTDYAKCLTYASHKGWVASGGLDRKIKIWDISKAKEIISMDTGPSNIHSEGSKENNKLHHSASKCSIYALTANPSGTIVVSGSPEKVVRLWDPKSGKRIGKLTGHTDNIRALLISEDGKHILSGSSDATIKLWSVAARRCLATYESHSDSVWSLYSKHPDLKTFYSGSRDGLVNRTEITGRAVSNSDGESIGLFKEDSGVAKIVVLNDTYVWTATSSSSINRWLSVPSHNRRQVLPRSDLNPEIPAKSIIKLQPDKDIFSSPARNSYIASDQTTVYAGSVLSIPVSYHEENDDDQDSIAPLRHDPDYTIEGRPGIVSHLMLQNRCQVLTKDTNGEAITVQLHKSTCFDCELYEDEIELPSDYNVREEHRLNLGKWVLGGLFREFIKIELEHQYNGNTRYIEDVSEKEDSLKNKANQNSSEATQQRNGASDQMSSAIPPQMEAEALKVPPTTDSCTTDHTPNIPPSPQVPQSTGSMTAPPASSPQPDYFSGSHHTPRRRESASQLTTSGAPASPSGGTFINRLKSLSIKAKLSRTLTNEDRPAVETPQPSSTMSPNTVVTTQALQTPMINTTEEATTVKLKEVEESESEVYTPVDIDEYPPLNIPESTIVMIAEESAEASTGVDLYRGTIGSISRDSDSIIEVAPSWLLSFLLYNKIPAKDAVKFTFILRPATDSGLEELPGG